MFSDYFEFLRIGRLLLEGRYGGLYPLPAVGFFALLSVLPVWLGLGLLTLGSLTILVALFKWRSLLWVLFIPILQVLTLGQVDILMLGLVFVGSPISLALLTLKPQLFVFAIPLLFKFTRKQFDEFMWWLVWLYVPITLVRPGWISEWLSNDDGRLSYSTGSTIWAMPVLLAAACIIVVAHLSPTPLGWMFIANPLYRSYDLSLLVLRGSVLLVPISWLLMMWSHNVGASWPFFLLLPIHMFFIHFEQYMFLRSLIKEQA